jgi:hypothetical protein
VRKQNPQIRWHLTRKEKDQIRRLTLRGVRQSVIARKLGITAPSVSKAQRAMGLNTRLIVPEERIMELFRAGWGGLRIHNHLKVPVNQIYACAHRNSFRRADGVGYPTPRGDVAGFIEALKRRDDYIENLAGKYGLAFHSAKKIAHEVLGTIQFAPGTSKPPLSSNFPQKHFDQEGA